MSTERTHISPAGAITAVAAIALVSLLVHAMLSTNTVRSTPVQPVALMAPPPRPPPAPEVQKIEEQQPVLNKALDMSDWVPGEPAANPGPGTGSGGTATLGALGVDEVGGSGSDAFGLAGKPGGTELLLTGGGGGGNPNARFLQFASQLQGYLAEQLNRLPELKQACYRVDIQVRVSNAGMIEDVRIRKSTGDRALDAAIGDALLQLAPMAASPPSDMPWPIGLEVVSRRAGCASGGVGNP